MLAAEAVKRLHADRGTLDEYSAFISQVDGAPKFNPAEAETLTWNAAEHSFLSGKGTALLEKYVADYPKGRYTVRGLSYLMNQAIEDEDDNDTYKWASLLVSNFPDNDVTEDALLVKAEIDYDRQRGMDALESWTLLEQKASTPENKNTARLGIMRVARESGDVKRMREASEALLSSSVLGSEEKTEAAFTRALAMKLNGETEGAISAWLTLASNADDLFGAQSAVYASDALNSLNRFEEASKTASDFVNSGTPHTYWLARGFIALSDAYKGLGRDFEAREYVKALKDNYPGNEQDIYEMIEERLK